MNTRIRFTAEYSYPGSFFAETSTRDIADGSKETALAANPDDHWYAVTVREITERKFTADNGSERWLSEGDPKKTSWVIGERIHWEDIPDIPANEILRSNIRCNSKDGYGVKTRSGNWQIASDYTEVIEL